MPDKRDHLTSQIDEAFKARTERMIAGHWASQRKIFEAGYRAGYAAATQSSVRGCVTCSCGHLACPHCSVSCCECTSVYSVYEFIKQGKSNQKGDNSHSKIEKASCVGR